MSDGYGLRGSAYAPAGRRRTEDRDEPEEIIQGLDLDDLDEEHVKNVIRQELESALGRDGGTLSQDRLQALRYYEGQPFGNEVEDGSRSTVVMRTVLEAVEWVLPALIRIFTASDRICVVEPPRPGMEDQAKQATEYLNHVFNRENEGFLILHDWFKDALLERLGWVKYYWDTQKTTETKSYSGVTWEEYEALLGDDGDVETVKLTKYVQDNDEFNLDRAFVPKPPPPGPPMPPPGPLPPPPSLLPAGTAAVRAMPPGLPPGPGMPPPLPPG